ncbi:MAG: methyltransferase domain-containing protein [Candidatus Taylorbacteria bacterium]|nr:methyltransferase domain-containing protein [Candidatus Taylorbacteria bacterium]
MFSDPQKNIAELGIQNGMKVVDLGAGSGFYTIEVAKKVGPSGRVYAVDVQKDLLDKIKNGATVAGLHNVEVVWGNIEKLGGTKLRETIADRIIISNTLFQIAPGDRENLALEIKRLLKSGGKLMVIDWNEDSPMRPIQPVNQLLVEGIFEKNGFIKEKSFDAGDHHYGIIFRKS